LQRQLIPRGVRLEMDMYSYANMSTYPFLDSEDIGKKIDMQQSGGYQKNYGENDKKILAGVSDTMAAFLIGFIVPFAEGIYLSFCKFTTIRDAEFVGFQNYIDAFKDSTFPDAFKFTTLFAIVTLVLINVLAFLVALALTQKIKGTNIFRTVFFMPNLIGGIVLGYVWQLIFDAIFSKFDTALKLNEVLGFWGLVILVCWQQIGYMMIVYIAGLQAIPEDIQEAAMIDGANRTQRLFRVTIPNMMPSITICTFLTITNSFKLFDQNLALTGGEPLHKTEMLALNIYETFYGRVGYEGVGQAKAVVFFILVVAIGLIQLKITRSKEVQQ
jgi:raffinose/stachyose/melibiose transport system permease protein